VTLPEIRLKPMELPIDFFSRSFAAIFPNGCKSINITDGIYRILKEKKQCDDMEVFADDFINGITEGFKLGSSYSDVTSSQAELSMESLMEICR